MEIGEKTEKTVLILLAAGDSRRFHGNKLLHIFNGKPMYQYLADEIDRLPEDFFVGRIVVTQYQEIMEELRARGYQVVANHESELGISHSIELGIQAADAFGSSCGYCFAVCDQPYLRAETVQALVEGFRRSGKGIGCLTSHGNLGNPAVFSHGYKGELLALDGDVGGRRVIKSHPDDLYLWEAENSRELVDVDVNTSADAGIYANVKI